MFMRISSYQINDLAHGIINRLSWPNHPFKILGVGEEPKYGYSTTPPNPATMAPVIYLEEDLDRDEEPFALDIVVVHVGAPFRFPRDFNLTYLGRVGQYHFYLLGQLRYPVMWAPLPVGESWLSKKFHMGIDPANDKDSSGDHSV